MENTKEVAEVVKDVVKVQGNNARDAAIIGGAMVVGALVYEKGIKPTWRWLKGKFPKTKKAAKEEIKDAVVDAKEAITK